MPIESEILDTPAAPEKVVYPPTNHLLFKGCLFMFLAYCSVLAGVLIALLVVPVFYLCLFSVYTKEILETEIKRAVLIGGVWLALPAIPILIVMFTVVDHSSSLLEALSLVFILSIFLLLIGAAVGLLFHELKKDKDTVMLK